MALLVYQRELFLKKANHHDWITILLVLESVIFNFKYKKFEKVHGRGWGGKQNRMFFNFSNLQETDEKIVMIVIL